MGDHRVVRFGVFEFDSAELQLRKGQHPVRLRPQALKLLRMFVLRPRQIITREAIHQELWTADVHVDFEQGVNHTIKQLRAALGDDANAPRYIETLTRRGYRFIAPIDVVPAVEAPFAAPAPSVSRSGARLTDPRVLLLAVAVLPTAAVLVPLLARDRDLRVALPPNATLAVMPFDVVNVAGDANYLGLSLADAVIARHARRALELEGTLAEAHEALAAVARHADFDWDRTIEQSVEALRLNASLDLPHYYLAAAFQHIGRLDLVEREVAAGLDANPLNLGEAWRLRGMAALWSGRFAEARTAFERLRTVSSKPVSEYVLAQALFYTGETARAEGMLRGFEPNTPPEQRGRAVLASFLAARGAKQEALTLVKDVLSHKYRDHHVAYSLGATYAGLGLSQEAFQWLRQAANTGLVCSAWYLNDPLLAPLRNHPGFAPFISEVEAKASLIGAEYARELARR